MTIEIMISFSDIADVPQTFAREWLSASRKFWEAAYLFSLDGIFEFISSSDYAQPQNNWLAHEKSAERCAGFALVPLPFALLTFARTAYFPRNVMWTLRRFRR